MEDKSIDIPKILENLKIMLDIFESDQDRKLTLIIDSVMARLKILLGGIEPPIEMEHIVLEVSVTRFNRIGSEGMSVNNVEGENQHFNANDFSGYMNEIQSYLESVHSSTKRGGFKLL